MGVKRTDNSKAFERKSKLAIISGLLITAELAATKVREKTPVRTGNLKSSIKSTGQVEQTKKDKYKISINASARYAPFVEFGTSKMSPRAMFRKTFSEDKTLLTETFKKVVKSNL